jgi:hypothetical protein
MSTTPVRTRDAVRIRRPRISIVVSLPNPAKALSSGSKPVKISVNKIPRATISTATHSNEKRTMVTIRISSKRAIGIVMKAVSCKAVILEQTRGMFG